MAPVPIQAPTRAISIRQPYVELILRGEKTREFRSRATRIRERVWLYAAKTPADDELAWRKSKHAPGNLPTGAILGSVEIVDCRWDPARECFAYLLRNPTRLRTPRHPKGVPMPSFWRPR